MRAAIIPYVAFPFFHPSGTYQIPVRNFNMYAYELYLLLGEELHIRESVDSPCKDGTDRAHKVPKV